MSLRSLVSVFVCLWAAASVNAANLSLSAASGAAGGNVSMDLSFSDTSGQSSAVQWTFTYPSAVSAVTVNASTALTAAGKTITCAAGAGSYTCVADGPNASALPNGVIATAQFTLASTASGTANIGLSGGLAASASGWPVTVNATGGAISIPVVPTLSALACSPATLTSGSSSTCSVTLSATAPAGGLVVALSDNNAALSEPVSVTVPGGAASATFSATAGAVSTAQTVTVTASLSGVSKTASVVVSASASLSAISCTPTTISSGGTSSCSVTLSSAAPSGGAAVTLSDNSSALTGPASVTVPAGASSASFAVSVGTVSSTQSATLSATYSSLVKTVALSLTPAPLSTIRVNAAGSAYTDPSGQVWSADSYFTGGYPWTISNTISNTNTQPLYQTSRYGVFTYNLPVPAGAYTVKLKFAESTMTARNQRLFNVAINGAPVLRNFDIFAEAGGAYIAIDKSYNVQASNGRISVQFTNGNANSPMINAIEVVPTAPLSTIRVNSGGQTYTDSQGLVWSVDHNFTGGYPFAVSGPVNGSTTSPELYLTQRYGPFSYVFSVPNGIYAVKLKFAESNFTYAGGRIFSVFINGNPVLSNFDIFAQAGGTLIPLDKSFPVSVTGGQITIQFMVGSANMPMINGVEITPWN